VWPPADLDRLAVTVTLLAPDGSAAFDSAAAGAHLPFALTDLRSLLLPGEVLAVRRDGDSRDLVTLAGAGGEPGAISPWVAQLIRRLPVEGLDAPAAAREVVATPLGRFEVTLRGDLRSVNAELAAVATRLLGYVGAVLAAILATWLAIEVAIIRRITLLTRRAAAVSSGVRGSAALADLDLSDLRGSDELGVLAQGLKDLLARVNEDTRRERIRAEQERNQWHAVGHEIVSPLQSLKTLHAAPDDPSSRYIERMLAAVRVLYGQASPSEAIASRALELAPLDLEAFLAQVAANAGFVGIEGVAYRGTGAPCIVRADEYSLEDVVTHVLRNAARHRTPGTLIEVRLGVEADAARVTIRNEGPAIADGMLERIFEYGVSDGAAGGDGARLGQGLYVARTYMAKMGGTIGVRNTDEGVTFTLTLQRA
jgi:signal transduction histidine kinase